MRRTLTHSHEGSLVGVSLSGFAKRAGLRAVARAARRSIIIWPSQFTCHRACAPGLRAAHAHHPLGPKKAAATRWGRRRRRRRRGGGSPHGIVRWALLRASALLIASNLGLSEPVIWRRRGYALSFDWRSASLGLFDVFSALLFDCWVYLRRTRKHASFAA